MILRMLLVFSVLLSPSWSFAKGPSTRPTTKKAKRPAVRGGALMSPRFRSFALRLVSTNPKAQRFSSWESGEIFPLSSRILLSGRHLREVRLLPDVRTGRPLIHLALRAGAKRQFALMTRRHKGRILAIVVGGKVVLAAPIYAQITSGILRIRLQKTQHIRRVYALITGR